MSRPIARLIAEKLIDIYVYGKLPCYGKMSRTSPEGFTRQRIEHDPENSLLQMILLSAYDRKPFTLWAGGFEQIAGLNPSKVSLPGVLRSAQLFTVAEILCLEDDEIDGVLTRCSFYGHHLASYASIRYVKTFKEAAQAVASLISDIRSAGTASDVAALHRKLQSIHGIGATIASKLIMYTLRESPYFGSSIHPRELYPAVKPIEKEYHVGNIAEVLRKRYGQRIIDDILNELKELEDPFAIDALFYIDREAPELAGCLFRVSTSEVSDKEEEMCTDNKRPLEVSLPSHKREVLDGIARDVFGVEASILAQVWIMEHLEQYSPVVASVAAPPCVGNLPCSYVDIAVNEAMKRWETIPFYKGVPVPFSLPATVTKVTIVYEGTGHLRTYNPGYQPPALKFSPIYRDGASVGDTIRVTELVPCTKYGVELIRPHPRSESKGYRCPSTPIHT